MKKGVDKAEGMWYYNKAVTEDRENEEMRRKFDERVAGAKTSKKNFKKVLDKLKTTWYNNQVAPRERDERKAHRDLEN